MKVQIFTSAAACASIGSSAIAQTAIVDPDALGHNDVVLHDTVGGGFSPYVDGTAFIADPNDLIVGNTGAGDLELDAFALIVERMVRLGRSAGAAGLLDLINGSTLSASNIEVGGEGDATMNILSGSTVNLTPSVAEDSVIGAAAGSTGTLNVSGAGSLLAIGGPPISFNFEDLLVGDAGTGNLNINDTGRVELRSGGLTMAKQSGSMAFMDVDGTGSVLDVDNLDSSASSDRIIVGDQGDATMRVTNGGLARSGGDTYIGEGADGVGLLSIDGAGSRLETGDFLSVGGAGDGTLRVTNAGQADIAGETYVAREAGSVGALTVDGAGSSLTGTWVHVGLNGTGQLDITNGGLVDASVATQVGAPTTGVGTLNVDGAGSELRIGSNGLNSLVIGSSGFGTANVTNGGTITGDSALRMSQTPDGDSVLHIDGAGSLVAMDTFARIGHGNSLDTSRNAEVFITDRGELRTSDDFHIDRARVTVDGAGSRLAAGDAPSDDLRMNFNSELIARNGAAIDVTGDARIGVSSSSSPTLDLHGSGTVLTAGATINSNTGQISVAAGAHMSSGTSTNIGTTGTLSVDGPGSRVSVGDRFVVSNTAAITNGGAVDAFRMIVNDTGAVSIGTDSDIAIDDRIEVDTGSITLQNNARLTIDNGFVFLANSSSSDVATFNMGASDSLLRIGDGAGPAGLLSVGHRGEATFNHTDGRVELNTSTLTLGSQSGSSGTYNLSGGVLDMGGGNITNANGDADFSFTGGRLEHANRIDLNEVFVQDGGVLAPGDSPGLTTIFDGYAFNAGSLEIEIFSLDGLGVGHDALSVTGGVSLLGSLDLHLDFAASLGDTFLIIENDGVDPVAGQFLQGTLASANFGALAYEFEVDYAAGDGNDVVLTLANVVPAPSTLGLLAMSCVVGHRRRRLSI